MEPAYALKKAGQTGEKQCKGIILKAIKEERLSRKREGSSGSNAEYRPTKTKT